MTNTAKALGGGATGGLQSSLVVEWCGSSLPQANLELSYDQRMQECLFCEFNRLDACALLASLSISIDAASFRGVSRRGFPAWFEARKTAWAT